MQKRTLIKKIKEIIRNLGELTSAEMQLDSSPCLNNIGGHTVQLIESFGQNKVTAVTYVHDSEADEDYISYEDLSKEILVEILFAVENYKMDFDKTMERCRD